MHVCTCSYYSLLPDRCVGGGEEEVVSANGWLPLVRLLVPAGRSDGESMSSPELSLPLLFLSSSVPSSSSSLPDASRDTGGEDGCTLVDGLNPPLSPEGMRCLHEHTRKITTS